MNAPTLFDRVIAALTALGLEVCATDPPEIATQVGADAWLRIGKGGEQADYAAVVQRKLTPATLGAATMQLQHVANATGHPTLLVTDYLTPPMAERRRVRGDAAG